MAITGPFATVVRSQLSAHPRFASVLRYVEEALTEDSAVRRRILGVAAGVTERVELEGGAFALEQAYQTKPRAEGFFESHRRYIDVQVIVSGEELMEVEEVRSLQLTEDHTAERDLLKYADTSRAARLVFTAGDVAVFFPADGHMPSLRVGSTPTLVHKTVVKVPVAE